MNSYMQMGYGFGVPMFFNSRVVGGVNIVGIDNSYYRFADWQFWRLRREVAKGLPVVLAFHDPLFEPSLYAILTGHLHFHYESMLTDTLLQFVSGGGYEGAAREVTLV